MSEGLSVVDSIMAIWLGYAEYLHENEPKFLKGIWENHSTERYNKTYEAVQKEISAEIKKHKDAYEVLTKTYDQVHEERDELQSKVDELTKWHFPGEWPKGEGNYLYVNYEGLYITGVLKNLQYGLEQGTVKKYRKIVER